MEKRHFWQVMLSIILVGFFLQQLLPWWSIALLAAVAAFAFTQKNGYSFLAGFLGGALLWGGYALLQNMSNGGILAERIGGVLGGVPGIAVVLITAILGGLVAGLAALSGNQLRALMK